MATAAATYGLSLSLRRSSFFPVQLCCCYPFSSSSSSLFSRRAAGISIASTALSISLAPIEKGMAETEASKKPVAGGIAGIENTRSWFQFYGDGFSIRVPPGFEDITEPEDYNAGMTLYGDKAKPKKYAAHFASQDGSEAVSVVIRPSNQLKITFLEAKDITNLGSLKQVAKIFVPGGAKLYSARTIKIKEDEETLRTYYFYEFGTDDQHIALTAAINRGKAYIAGAAAPGVKWDNDGVKLRSAAMSLSLL